MIIDHSREKLIQAVVFFARHVRKLGKVKLFKLLYFLDFQHFRDTGRSVTGLDYSAWQMGPVPVSLYGELDAPEPDWIGKVEFKTIPVARGRMLSVHALADFDAAHFTKRELKLLKQLAEEFRDTDADDMIEATHLEHSPWHKVWVDEGRRQAPIPYAYALRQQEVQEMGAIATERQEVIEALR